MRIATALSTLLLLVVWLSVAAGAEQAMIESGAPPADGRYGVSNPSRMHRSSNSTTLEGHRAHDQTASGLRLAAYDPCDEWWNPRGSSAGRAAGSSGPAGASSLNWLDGLRVGYDNGFIIASQNSRDLQATDYAFRLKFNGWGQLRHSRSEWAPPNLDLNQFQLKRGRLIFSGTAFNPNFFYFIQLDGRSSGGDDIRLLDYYLSFDFGRDQFGLKQGTIGFRTGKFKVPFTLARWLSGKQFEFNDRSVASTFFDVNRSFAWGLYGETSCFQKPVAWEAAVFNGLVTGGAETGSSGNLDENFAYSARIYSNPIGDWGAGSLADFDWHDCPAVRVGCGFATSRISRSGLTEFNTLRVVDSGATLASLLPAAVQNYVVTLYSADASVKYRGWSATLEYYWRGVSNFTGGSSPDLFDNGYWLQLGWFVVPRKLQLLTRWSRVVGDSGTLGGADQSVDEVAGGFAWHFRDNHAKLVFDVTNVNGAPIDSAALDITPGDRGALYRTQIQFSF